MGPAAQPSATAGFDFAGHRQYGVGDDLRALDWNALARWGEPVIRRFRDAAPREVWFAIDRSPSMQFGHPSKEVLARRIAGAIGALAIAGGAAAGILGETLAPRRPTAWLARLERLPKSRGFLAPKEFEAARSRRAREWILLTDPYEFESVRKLLTVAVRPGESVVIATITSAEDRAVPTGAVRAEDSESGERRDVAPGCEREFASRFDALRSAWRSLAARHGAKWIELDCAAGWEEAAAGILAARAGDSLS